MRFFARLLQALLILPSYVVPRNKKLIAYADNNLNSSIYLFRHAARQHDGYRHVYLTPLEDVYQALKSEGYDVSRRWSASGIYTAFRAKTYVVSSSKGQINNPLSRHAMIINLWHGISVKKIGLMTYRSPEKLARKAKEFSAFSMVPSTSPLTQHCFMQAFGKTAEETPILGEPRNDFLVQNRSKRNTRHLASYVSVELHKYRKIIGYLPTWRDYGRWDDGIDHETLNRQLASKNDLLIIKPHPKDENFRHFQDLSHIKLATRQGGWQDAYEILVGLDVLITDYSSLAYEFVLLERPVILYTPDFDRFLQDRELWISYDEIAPAERIENFTELQRELSSALEDGTLGAKYWRSVEKLHTVKDGSSCEKVYTAIKSMLR